MKRTLSVCALICVSLIFSSLNVNAQVNQAANNLAVPAEQCGFDAVHQERLINDPELCKKLGKNAYIYVSDNLSWETYAKNMETVFEETLAKQ